MSGLESNETDVTGELVSREMLTPDDALLVQEIVDDFDAIAHLYLRLFGHGQHGPDQLARLHIMKGRDARAGNLFELAAETGQGKPPSS